MEEHGTDIRISLLHDTCFRKEKLNINPRCSVVV